MNIIRLIALAACMVCVALPAWAETSIAVVDAQAILTQSEAAKSVEKQISDYKAKFLDELSKQEQSLRESEKKLGEERATLRKEDFTAKAKQLEEKFIQTGSVTQTKKRAMDKASSSAVSKLHAKLYEIVQVIAKEKGYNLVITKQNVIVGEQSIDITEEAMTRFNEQLPTITLDFSAE
jgi:outer membrane protein